MEFLYKLYDKEYFGIMLFILITVLLLLFLIILFFGKKDEKKKLEETKKLELANADAFKEVDDNTKELKVPEIEQPVVEENKNVSLDSNDNNNSNIANTKFETNDVLNVQSFIPNSETSNVDNIADNNININDLFDEEDETKEVTEHTFNDNDFAEEKSTPVTFELPKMAEMPKLKEEKNITNVLEDQKDMNNIFDNIESETYDIK